MPTTSFMRKDLFDAKDSESPAAYAESMGWLYAESVPASRKKATGQFFTPLAVAEYMASFVRSREGSVRILDPGAGILSCAVCTHLVAQTKKPFHIYIEAFESDHALAGYLEKTLSFLDNYLESHGVSFEYSLRNDDFIMTYAEAINDAPSLFAPKFESPAFDIAISNPPYFKIPKTDPRARAASSVIHGQPNIYALFMAISAVLLTQKGEFIFITPRSFTSGPYFRAFREHFFKHMQPKAAHLFDSRKTAFKKDKVLQENIILKAERIDNWSSKSANHHVVISSSNGDGDFSKTKKRNIPLNSVLDMKSRAMVFGLPTSKTDDTIIKWVNAWTGRLQSYGLQISTGPVVPFRAANLLSAEGEPRKTHTPLLWMQNVRTLSVNWPTEARGKAQYITSSEKALPLLVADNTYVLMRRFSAKEELRRLVAAPLLAGQLGEYPHIGLENHLNYIYRPHGVLTEDEAWGLAVLLSSSFLDTYFRIHNGNTQVSATELRAMPLPPIEVIRKIGCEAKNLSNPVDEIDALASLAFNGRNAV